MKNLALAMSIVAFVVSVAQVAHQQPTWDPPTPPPEKYPGQREHARPPEDYVCRRQDYQLSVPETHACTCERMFNPDDPTNVLEDKACNVWCHMDKCGCGIGGHGPDGCAVDPAGAPRDPQ